MEKSIETKIQKQISKINDFIEDYFKSNLITIAAFGSFYKKENFKITSDIDYIIILRSLREHQDEISRDLKIKLKNVFPLVAFNIYGKDNFVDILENNFWFVLTIKTGHKVYIDKNNFFKENIESSFRKIKQQKVGQLAWSIDNQKISESILNHYIKLSGQYLKSAKLLYKNQLMNVSLELLLNSVHCFMISKLLERKIFITTGEITQLFFNIYQNKEIFEFRDLFLKLEQKVNQKHSFDFDGNGEMSFLSSYSSENELIIKKSIKGLEKLQTFFLQKY